MNGNEPLQSQATGATVQLRRRIVADHVFLSHRDKDLLTNHNFETALLATESPMIDSRGRPMGNRPEILGLWLDRMDHAIHKDDAQVRRWRMIAIISDWCD